MGMKNKMDELFLGIWGIVKEYAPEKDRETIAHQLLTLFDDHGYTQLMIDISGEDEVLDAALHELGFIDPEADDDLFE
jgi:hypothetical protein